MKKNILVVAAVTLLGASAAAWACTECLPYFTTVGHHVPEPGTGVDENGVPPGDYLAVPDVLPWDVRTYICTPTSNATTCSSNARCIHETVTKVYITPTSWYWEHACHQFEILPSGCTSYGYCN